MAISEKRREYLRRWRAENRDKLREQRKTAIRNKALKTLENASIEESSCVVVRSSDGAEYVLRKHM